MLKKSVTLFNIVILLTSIFALAMVNSQDAPTNSNKITGIGYSKELCEEEFGVYDSTNGKCIFTDDEDDSSYNWGGASSALGPVANINSLRDFDSKNIASAEKSAAEALKDINTDPKTGTSYIAEYFALRQGSYQEALASGAQWGVTVYFGTNMIASFLGFEDATTEALSTSFAVGAFSGRTLQSLIGESGEWQEAFKESYFGSEEGFGLSADKASFIGGAAIAAIIFVMMYSEETTETITFDCEPWEASVGGSKCELCNEQTLPCSEYQCRSLGQACQLLNDEESGEAQCAWINRHDTEYPVIQPWTEALHDDYVYTPDNAISPPDRGVRIVPEGSTKECVKAFTPLSFGIILDEPAQCKLDYERVGSFEEMKFNFGGSSLFRYNHTQILSLPSPNSIEQEELTIQNDGDYSIHVRCQDANGNYNTANFVFNFCVEEGPDTTAPLIVSTNILNKAPIAYNQSSVDLEVYVNEPSECRWSKLDQSYEDMTEEMTCSNSVLEMNAQMLYECQTTLTGLNDKEDNIFYFRCKDQPNAVSDRNTNAESYEFTLIGTEPLVIDEIEPNNTKVEDSTDAVLVTLKVETAAGYKEGEASCYYSETDEDGDYILFYDTESYYHEQDLYLTQGYYEYFIKCVDLGGNTDKEKINFTVETDTEAPIVIRTYHEDNYMKIITNEEATCYYDTIDCTFPTEDAVQMTATNNNTEHYADWNTENNYYIKCNDDYGNQVDANECNIIVKPSEV